MGDDETSSVYGVGDYIIVMEGGSVRTRYIYMELVFSPLGRYMGSDSICQYMKPCQTSKPLTLWLAPYSSLFAWVLAARALQGGSKAVSLSARWFYSYATNTRANGRLSRGASRFPLWERMCPVHNT